MTTTRCEASSVNVGGRMASDRLRSCGGRDGAVTRPAAGGRAATGVPGRPEAGRPQLSRT
jgi:hypothetical protein